MALATCICATAHAQPPDATPGDPDETTVAKPTPEDANKKRAQALLDIGNRLVAVGDFTTALDKFREAHELFPSPKLLLNIGTTLRHLGRNAEAAEIYATYVGHPEAEQERIAELRGIIDELDALIGHVTIDVPLGDSTLRVDGRVIERFSGKIEMRLDPGPHTIVADKEGLRPAVRTLPIAAGEYVAITLEPTPPPGPVTIEVPADGTTQRVVGYGVGGLGIAGLVIGGVFGLLANTTNDDAKTHCATPAICDPTGVELGNDAISQATVSTVAFAVGAVGLTAGVVVYLTAPEGDGSHGPEVGIGLEPNRVMLLGHW